MIIAKNYETVFKFVKVMPRKLVASFFSGHGVYKNFLPVLSNRRWMVSWFLCTVYKGCLCAVIDRSWQVMRKKEGIGVVSSSL